jgi:hypothetical protein
MKHSILLLVLCISYSIASHCNNTYRSYDGSCNNRNRPTLGQIGFTTIENAEPGSFPESGPYPNERVLSNAFFKGPAEIKNNLNVSLLFTFFSEVEDSVAHGFRPYTSSGIPYTTLYAGAGPLAALDFPALRLISTISGFLTDPTDPFSPSVNPNITLPYLLAIDANHTIKCQKNLVDNTPCNSTTVCCYCAENAQTPYDDLSYTVYPGDPNLVPSSRTGVNGKLKMYTLTSGEQIPPTFAQTGRPIPIDANNFAVAPSLNPNTTVDIASSAGGLSLNVITTMSLYYREHNRLAAQFKAANPSWTDEQIFQKARAWNIAQMQAIKVYEWLPVALGPLYSHLFCKNYPGYNPNGDPTVYSSFDMAYRAIHSTLYEELSYVAPGPTTVFDLPAVVAVGQGDQHINLLETAFTSSIDPILRGWIVQPANALDSIYAEFVRTLLPPGSFAPGLDLGSSDIKRQRMDHVANYRSVRKFWRGDDPYYAPGCVPGVQDSIQCFLFITSNFTVAATLQALYNKVSNIDLHVGALVENRMPGVIMPVTYAYILADGLDRSRRADAYWFENVQNPYRQFSNAEIQQIKKTRFFDLIQRNTGINCGFPANLNSFYVYNITC